MTGPRQSDRFQTTVWSQIRAARSDEAAIHALVLTYWTPVYAFLRRSGLSDEDAIESTQAFVCDRLLNRRLIEHADERRGRFRNLLLRSLKNYLIDQKAKERDGAHQTLLDARTPRPPLGRESSSPEESFEREWARFLFQETLRRTEQQCHSAGQTIHWTAFERAHPELFSHGLSRRPANDEIAQEVGARDAAHVSILLNTVRRKYKRILCELISETLEDGESVESEIERLRAAL
ncbi:MAG: hypothetical protein ACF8PN_05675 [Phycisphaerales bacterium]